MHSTLPAAPVRLRLRVLAHDSCPGWAIKLRQMGWRTFTKPQRGSASMMTCIIKRANTCFLINQDLHQAVEQVLEVPPDEAPAIAQQLVASGVAVPA